MKISLLIIAILVIGCLGIGITDYNMQMSVTYGMSLNNSIEDMSSLNKTSSLLSQLEGVKAEILKDMESPLSALSMPIHAVKALVLYIDFLNENDKLINSFTTSEGMPLPMPWWLPLLITSIILVLVVSLIIDKMTGSGREV